MITLAYTGGNVVVNSLAPREAAYFKVTIPANTPSWEVTLAPSVGEMMLAVRRGTVPDFNTRNYGDAGTPSIYGDWQVEMHKAGPERYVLLPPKGQDYLIPTDYYVAVISEGQNPVDGSTPVIGTATSNGEVTSVGALAVTNLGTACVSGITQAVSLFGRPDQSLSGQRAGGHCQETTSTTLPASAMISSGAPGMVL